jgi:F-type H+-transporting ATPase subunit b
LRQEVATLALKAAEQILQKEINKAEHNDIIAKVSSQLGQA